MLHLKSRVATIALPNGNVLDLSEITKRSQGYYSVRFPKIAPDEDITLVIDDLDDLDLEDTRVLNDLFAKAQVSESARKTVPVEGMEKPKEVQAHVVPDKSLVENLIRFTLGPNYLVQPRKAIRHSYRVRAKKLPPLRGATKPLARKRVAPVDSRAKWEEKAKLAQKKQLEKIDALDTFIVKGLKDVTVSIGRAKVSLLDVVKMGYRFYHNIDKEPLTKIYPKLFVAKKSYKIGSFTIKSPAGTPIPLIQAMMVAAGMHSSTLAEPQVVKGLLALPAFLQARISKLQYYKNTIGKDYASVKELLKKPEFQIACLHSYMELVLRLPPTQPIIATTLSSLLKFKKFKLKSITSLAPILEEAKTTINEKQLPITLTDFAKSIGLKQSASLFKQAAAYHMHQLRTVGRTRHKLGPLMAARTLVTYGVNNGCSFPQFYKLIADLRTTAKGNVALHEVKVSIKDVVKLAAGFEATFLKTKENLVAAKQKQKQKQKGAHIFRPYGNRFGAKPPKLLVPSIAPQLAELYMACCRLYAQRTINPKTNKLAVYERAIDLVLHSSGSGLIYAYNKTKSRDVTNLKVTDLLNVPLTSKSVKSILKAKMSTMSNTEIKKLIKEDPRFMTLGIIAHEDPKLWEQALHALDGSSVNILSALKLSDLAPFFDYVLASKTLTKVLVQKVAADPSLYILLGKNHLAEHISRNALFNLGKYFPFAVGNRATFTKNLSYNNMNLTSLVNIDPSKTNIESLSASIEKKFASIVKSPFLRLKLGKVQDKYGLMKWCKGIHGISPLITKVYETSSTMPKGDFKFKVEDIFHGTDLGSFNMISVFGFSIKKVKVGRSLGNGVYFAPNPDKSVQYLHGAGFSRKKATGVILHCDYYTNTDPRISGRFRTEELVVPPTEFKGLHIKAVYIVSTLPNNKVPKGLIKGSGTFIINNKVVSGGSKKR